MILDDADITEYEINNPVMSSFMEENNRVDVLKVCDYLIINDSTFGDSETITKVEKVISMLGKENLMDKLEKVVSEVGYKPGMLDDIYAKLVLDKEISRQSDNLNNLLKQKYGNNHNL